MRRVVRLGTSTPAGRSPLGITRTSRAPRLRASAARAADAQTTTRARGAGSARTATAAVFASSTSVPQSLHHERLARRQPRHCGRQASVHARDRHSREARRAARANERRKSGRSSTRHFRARRLLTIPSPYAMPKWRNEDGRDDVDLDPRSSKLRQRRPPRTALRRRRVARVRRRQNTDPHAAWSRLPKTAGAAIASIANTKK